MAGWDPVVPGRALQPLRPEQGWAASSNLSGNTPDEQVEVVKRDEQRWPAHLAEGELGLEQVAPLDGAGEASIP